MSSNALHVCILTTAHPVDDVRVRHKFAQTFQNAGFRVSWAGPGHAFFDPSATSLEGIEFHFAPPIRTKRDRLLAGRRTHKAASKLEPVDVFYAPDPDAIPIALALAKQHHAKVIFDIHEQFHGAMLDRWLPRRGFPLVRKLVLKRIQRLCAQCDLVLAVNQSLLEAYLQGSAQGLVVRSCAPAWFADGPPAVVCPNDRPFTIMHGKCALARGTLPVLEALAKLPGGSTGMRVVMFCGSAPEKDRQAQAVVESSRQLGVTSALDLRSGVPMQDMPGILRSCDVGLIAYGRGLGAESLPNRLFEYMALGLPVIAPTYSIEIAKILREEACGLLADFEDPDSIAQALHTMYHNQEECRTMGQRAREAFLKRHNWDQEIAPVLAWMHSCRTSS